MIQICLNNITLYQVGGGYISDANPDWHFAITTPTATVQWNESDRFDDGIYRFSFEAITVANLAYNNGGVYWRVRLALFGFGFNISRQSGF